MKAFTLAQALVIIGAVERIDSDEITHILYDGDKSTGRFIFTHPKTGQKSIDLSGFDTSDMVYKIAHKLQQGCS